MRVVFLGSPEFALPTLRRLIDSEHEIVGVYTQPDRPTGRGRKLAPPPVKSLALEQDLPVFQPDRISSRDSVAQLRALAPDIGVLAAYGQILRQPVLDVPPLGILNVHASLLPRWRGAAPIPAAILAGDAETGATIMKIVLALDAGPTLGAISVPMTDADTTATLTPKVAEAGADLLMQLLPQYAAGALTPVPQDDALATYAPQLEKDDGRIDWTTETADQIARKVRAYNPWPMAWTTLDNHPLRIIEANSWLPSRMNSQGRDAFEGPPGKVCAFSNLQASPFFGSGFAVITKDGYLATELVQLSGSRAMSSAEFLNGHPDIAGTLLGT